MISRSTATRQVLTIVRGPNNALFKELVAPPGDFSLMVQYVPRSYKITFSVVVIITTWHGDLTRAFCEGGVGEKVNFTDNIMQQKSSVFCIQCAPTAHTVMKKCRPT